MRTPTLTARRAQAEDTVSLVLEAERAALTAVEHYRRQMLQLVAISWLRAELVRKRTEARTQRIRERMKAAARVRQESIGSEIEALAGDMGKDLSMLAPLDAAVSRVTEELAGVPESS
jgi:hypothetical protein